MIVPLGDINRRKTVPFINYSLIAANLAVFVYMISKPELIDSLFEDFALYPNRVQFSDLITSMFLHAGVVHLIGNLWFLWIVGDNVEDKYGHWIYLAFYILAGFVAGIVHIVTITPEGATIPTVGASGAISGMMGAYVALFPRAKILFWVFPWSFFAGLIKIPAIIAIGSWFALQVYMVWGYEGKADLVAYWAHIGGFVFGMFVTLMLRLFKLVQPGDYLPPSEEAA